MYKLSTYLNNLPNFYTTMKKFCPKCGRIISKGTFCSDCKKVELEFKKLRIRLCPSHRYFYKGKWTKFDELSDLSEKIANESVKGKVKVIRGLEYYENLLEKTGINKELNLLVKQDGEEYLIPISVEVTLSPAISKMGSEYFEGVLQIRNSNKEVKDYISNYLEKNEIIVNKQTHKKNSSDYYFATKKQIGALAIKLMRNFGGIIDKNAKLFSYNKLTSKDIFRTNVLVTIPPFNLEQVIFIDSKPVLVKKLDKISGGINLLTGKKFTFKLNKENLNEFKILKKYKTNVTKTHPKLEVMDPETYQSVRVKNPLEISFNQGEKIVVIKYRKDYFVVK